MTCFGSSSYGGSDKSRARTAAAKQFLTWPFSRKNSTKVRSEMPLLCPTTLAFVSHYSRVLVAVNTQRKLHSNTTTIVL